MTNVIQLTPRPPAGPDPYGLLVSEAAAIFDTAELYGCQLTPGQELRISEIEFELGDDGDGDGQPLPAMAA